ncbi:hypothetical protein PV334_33810 [Streptomyces sp. ME02-7008A-1]|uniref:hypothetical protein n=1 Tax=unclassified Streptomyces TaxID=2593676 RepID=UPI0029BF1FBA|nr:MULTISPECIES: hypothetical protein [unclassified Streptomyces]MDX3186215.1 hypothetical protein [Streptomyces sp. ME02-7008A-1]MDX3307336.1 hypothetical protein [Streptomyces sp. ME02-7008A]
MGLNLPLQREAIDRRGAPLDFMVLLAVAEDEADGKIATTWIMGRPQGSYGPDPYDPAAMLRLDPRGWHCLPGGGCAWKGRV